MTMKAKLCVGHATIRYVTARSGRYPHSATRYTSTPMNYGSAVTAAVAERYRNNNSVIGTDPQPIRRYQERGDTDEREAQLTSTLNKNELLIICCYMFY